MKLLLLLILAALGWLWWRYVRVSGRAADRPPPAQPAARPQPGTPQAMVDCPVCGLHMPQADAVSGRLGMYCSEDHRARHEG